MSDRAPRWIVGAVLASAVALRLPAIVEPLGIDQGIFAYAGRALLRGEMLYRDVWDQKPPGIHLTYATGFFILGDRPATVFLLDLMASLGTAALLAPIGRRMLGRPGAGGFVALVFLLGTWPAARYGYGGILERAVPETFISFWITAAVFFLLAGTAPGGWRRLATAGACCGIAAVYKPTAAVYLVAFASWMAMASASVPSRAAVTRLLSVVTMAAGFSVPLAVAIGWLVLNGAAREAWIAVVEYNAAYVAAVSNGPVQLVGLLAREVWRLIKTDPLWLLGACGALVALWRARSGDRHAALALAWLAAAGLAIAANGGRLFSTYFVQAQPALAILAAGVALAVWQAPSRSASARALGRVTLLIGLSASVAHAHALSRGRAALALDLGRMRGAIDERTFLEQFGGYGTGRGYSARANAELAAYLTARTRPDAQVFIFGFEPGVYYAANRRAASRYLFIGPIVAGFLPHRPEFTLEGLAAELERRAPDLLILERHNRDRFLGWDSTEEFARPPMRALVARHYAHETTIEDFELYRLRVK